MQVGKKTEGVIALEKLQNDGYTVWSREEVKNSSFSDNTKKSLFFIAKENSLKRIPHTTDIKKIIKRTIAYREFMRLKKKELVFAFTISEIMSFYGLKLLGYIHGYWDPPKPLGWLKPYLYQASKKRSSVMSRIKHPRRDTDPRHYVALVEVEVKEYEKIYNEPCFYPLRLHIPKRELLSA